MFLREWYTFSINRSLRCTPQIAYSVLLVILLASAATADADHLRPFLAPTSVALELLFGYSFEYIPMIGYVDDAAKVAIAPECSGLRFFVIASVVGLSIIDWFGTFRQNLMRTLFIALSAYCSTIGANVVRISSTLRIETFDVTVFDANPADLHVIIGSFTYFLCLALFAVTVRGLSHVKTT